MFLNIDVLEDTNNIPLNFDKPYILKNNKMVAVKKWNLNYLKKKLSDSYVKVEYYKSIEDYQNAGGVVVDKKFSEYMSDMENGKLCYLSECELKFLENVLDKNDTKERFKFKRSSYKKHLYLGINTYTNSHIHLGDDIVLNQIYGKKLVYMYDYYDNPSLKLNSIFIKKPNCINCNFWTLDLTKYKLYKVVLEPGDCLLIPPWWHHAVKGIGLSYSVSMFYERTDLNYFKMGNLKIRDLIQYLDNAEIIILYFIIRNILFYVL